MTPAVKDVTIAARVAPDLRADLEAVAAKLGDKDLSIVIRRACAEYADKVLERGDAGPGGLLDPVEVAARNGLAAGPLGLATLNGSPRAHVNGPATSKEAAAAAWPRANTQRRRAVELLLATDPRGMTGDELDAELGGYNGRRRLSELKAGGWVEPLRVRVATRDVGTEFAPLRRKTRNGAYAEVYVLTAAARVRLADESKRTA